MRFSVATLKMSAEEEVGGDIGAKTNYHFVCLVVWSIWPFGLSGHLVCLVCLVSWSIWAARFL
jgi:hypothetical protein